MQTAKLKQITTPHLLEHKAKKISQEGLNPAQSQGEVSKANTTKTKMMQNEVVVYVLCLVSSIGNANAITEMKSNYVSVCLRCTNYSITSLNENHLC